VQYIPAVRFTAALQCKVEVGAVP